MSNIYPWMYALHMCVARGSSCMERSAAPGGDWIVVTPYSDAIGGKSTTHVLQALL